MDSAMAEQQTLLLGSGSEGLELNVYRMVDGELRIGVQSAARLLGYRPDRLREITEKASRNISFTGEIKRVVIGGTQDRKEVQTVSVSDFVSLILYAALQGRKQALLLSRLLSSVGLQSFATVSAKQKDTLRQLVDSIEDILDSAILRRAVEENSGFTSLELVIATYSE